MAELFSKTNLPPADDPRWQTWRKRPVTVRMMPLSGPATIVTVDAPTDLPAGWEGWLAIDAAGHPYPLHRDVQAVIYERAVLAAEQPRPEGGAE